MCAHHPRPPRRPNHPPPLQIGHGAPGMLGQVAPHVALRPAMLGDGRRMLPGNDNNDFSLPCTTANLAIIVFTNLGSETGLICKPQLRPVTTPKCCEAVSRNPINKEFTYNGLPQSHTVDLSPQFRKGNFDVVCSAVH